MKEFMLWAWGGVVIMLSGVNPEAAAGAAFGGMFFWSLSPKLPLSTRCWLMIASVGLGYGTALPAVRSDNGWAWIIAGLAASLAHVVIMAIKLMVETGSPVPPWVKDIFAALPLPWRKNQGEDKP